MSERRCNAATGAGEGQCRCTKNLTRTRITIHREKYFLTKLAPEAIIDLCPLHFKLTCLERVLMTTAEKPAPERTAQVKAAPGQAMNAARKARGLRPSGFGSRPS